MIGFKRTARSRMLWTPLGEVRMRLVGGNDFMKIRVGRWASRLWGLAACALIALGLWSRWFHTGWQLQLGGWLVVGVLLLMCGVYGVIELDGYNRELRRRWLLFGFLPLWMKGHGFDDARRVVVHCKSVGAEDQCDVWEVYVELVSGKKVRLQRYEAWSEMQRVEMTTLARKVSDMMGVPMLCGGDVLEEWEEEEWWG
ncbi:hypothetical protein [Poriferisphaera sp. WC338]|uniref:hypothetical protein n=1 Tax=Poriferisphaera sp. WC338 TaxID=3425129 RepID=UPI003D814357